MADSKEADGDLYDGLAGGSAVARVAPPTTAFGRMTGRRGGPADGSEGARPMTSVKAAGFQSKSSARTLGAIHVTGSDAPSAAGGGPPPPLLDKAENGPEEVAKALEWKVHGLIDASAQAASKGDVVMALERAKEAGRKERQLKKFRDAKGMADSNNMELTLCCAFNLAQAYHSNKMYTEALSTYNLIIKNKLYTSSARLRINMGNIHFEEKKYTQAIKMYRMALDQLPPTSATLKRRVQRNIGHSFVRLGQFQEAITAFENIMDEEPEFMAGFNLVVCYYALGDVELMKKGFLQLLAVPLPEPDEEEEAEDADEGAKADGDEGDEVDEAAAAARLDDAREPLREEMRARQKSALAYVTNAARLIGPTLCGAADWVGGYEWTIEQLRREHPSVASELSMAKALEYMAHKQFERAIEELKAFERKDVRLKARAATNLSFIYFLEGDVPQASKYANLAVKHDRYNAKALVNLGNCLVGRGEYERAKELYLEAIGVEADCLEAIFNLGLVNKQLGVPQEALQAFEKLHTLAPSSPEVIYQIANLHEGMGNYRDAIKYFNYLLTKVPSDPGALARLGQIFEKDDDATQAFHYHNEAYRCFPVKMEVISWLGIFYVRQELYEKAIEFFERATEIQPTEIKWKLMVASCHRRMHNNAKAFECYEAIHAAHPSDPECLRYLVLIAKDLGRRSDAYEASLAKIERTLALQQVPASGGGLYDGGSYLEYDAPPVAAAAAARGGAGGGYGAGDEYDYAGGGYSAAASYGGGVSSSAAGGASRPSSSSLSRPTSALSRPVSASDARVGGAGGGAAGGGSVSSRPPSAPSAALPSLDSGFGSTAEKFAAPNVVVGSGGGGGGAGRKKDDEFGDANVDDLLTE